MKTFLVIRRTGAMLIALFITASLLAQGGSSTKEIRKEFTVTPNTRLEVMNKYGNVDLVNRNDNVMTIDVVVKVNVRDQQRAEELLKMININISQSGDQISAVTDINEDFGRYFRGFNSDNGLEINYKIAMPKTVPVNLSNKYGNVFIDELESTSTIDVRYGKLTANKLLHDSKQPLTKVYLSYSNGSIQETKWIELDIKYSKISITECKALAILSKYSKLNVSNASSIVSESKYDTYEIGNLNNFVTTAAYGHFSINNLSGKLQVDTKYTDVIIDHIPPNFEGIKINNSYGSFRLGIDQGASYKINGYSKYCNITYPEGNARVNRFNENNEMKVEGVIGNSQNAKAEVSVTSNYGNIRLIP